MTALAAALVTVAMTACGETQVDTGRAESAIREQITRQTGVRIDSVRCPEDVAVERGGTFRCVAIASNGQRGRVEVTQRDEDGGVSWRLLGR